jgi:hypothetical protein
LTSLLALLATGVSAQEPAARLTYAWPQPAGCQPLAERIAPPPGFTRTPAPAGSFATWLRGLPLQPGRPAVHLFNGRLKGNQEAQHAVVAIDVGGRDLQQCADAVIRLRAEYLWNRGCNEHLAFRLTNGDLAAWSRWRAGERPSVRGNTVNWRATAAPAEDHTTFRRFLDFVFSYAGTLSLARELVRVDDPSQIEIGDVFIQGGSPGHAVLVVDVAADAADVRVFLLAQSYMPAQEIHVLRNPSDDGSPWYRAAASGALPTPEWGFEHTDLHRFVPLPCEPVPSSIATAVPSPAR